MWWEESVEEWGPGLLEALREIEDPRKPKGVRHPLAGSAGPVGMCHAQRRQESLTPSPSGGVNIPSLPSLWVFSRERTPCVATLHHVFRRLDVEAFESALGRWAQDCLGEGEATIAIDGKALRGDTRR